MTDLAKALSADLEVRTLTRLASVGRGAAGGWSATLEDGSPLTETGGAVLEADAVICTPPVPQTLDLLAQGGVFLQSGVAGALGAIRYDPTLAGLVVLDGPSSVPAPGGAQFDEGFLSWVSDNQAKGISPVAALTLHARGDVSARHWDDAAATSLARLQAEGSEWMGSATVVASELAKWRYAAPTALYDDRCLVAVDGTHPLVCAGDAFGEARVEGAARSGLAAAAAVLDRLG